MHDGLDSDASWINRSKVTKILERTGSAIVAHVKKVKSKFLVYDGNIKTIKSARPTGDPKEEHFERAALSIYNKEATVSDMYRYLRWDESPDQPFPYLAQYCHFKTTSNFAMIESSGAGKVLPLTISSVTSAPRIDGSTGSPAQSDGATLEQSSGEVAALGGGAAAAVVKEATKTGRGYKRPVGNKKTAKILDQTRQLGRGASGIQSLAKAAHKRVRVSKDALTVERKKTAVDKMKAIMQIFAMEGACPVNRAIFCTKDARKSTCRHGRGAATGPKGDGVLVSRPIPQRCCRRCAFC